MTMLFATVVFVPIISSVLANPLKPMDGGTKPAPADTKPSTILIVSPVQGSRLNGTCINLNVNVTAGQTGAAIDKITYTPSWEGKTVNVNLTTFNCSLPIMLSINFTDVPEGNQSLTVLAVETGIFFGDIFHYYHFYLTSVSSVEFAVDRTPPIVSLKSVENMTYSTSDVSLSFTVNEPCSQFSYVLDGKKEETIAGNTTLRGLSEGTHNVTVFAADEAGNIGASETIDFTVAKPESETFPTTLIATASGASILAAALGVVVYFKKRKRMPQNT